MSYEITCDACGAVSPGENTVCPYCKNLLHAAGSSTNATPPPAPAPVSPTPAAESRSANPSLIAPVQALYREGKIDKAVGLLNTLLKQRPDVHQDPEVLILHVKILLESEGSATQMKTLLEKARQLEPANPRVAEYQEVVEAKGVLDLGVKARAEELLRKAAQRYPRNEHAQLLLGTHLFWSRGDIDLARQSLEKCVTLRPVMLRAWACLGALYSTLGREEIAAAAFRKCLELETHPKMIAYFQSVLKKS